MVFGLVFFWSGSSDPDILDKMDLLESRLSLAKELVDSKLLVAHHRLFHQCLSEAWEGNQIFLQFDLWSTKFAWQKTYFFFALATYLIGFGWQDNWNGVYQCLIKERKLQLQINNIL